MKNIYFLFSLMLAVVVATAQVPVQFNSKPRVANVAKAPIDTRGAGGNYIDYAGYDSYVNSGNFQSFVNWVNENSTTAGDFLYVVQTFDSLEMSPDYFNWFAYDYTNHSIHIDSIFYGIHHQNNSGLDDTLTVSIIALGSAPNYRPTSTVLWSNQTITSVDLTGHPTTPGSYPTGTFYELPNFDIPAGTRFGIKIDYAGDVTDTFGIIFGYPHDGSTLCGTSSSVYSPVVSAFYPAAFYNAKTSAGSTLYPTTTGTGYWYYDCNSNNTPQWPQENPYQDWTISAYATIGPVGVHEISNNSIGLFQNNPNPVSNETVIRYSLKKGSNVSIEVTDLTGRVVSVLNEGYKSAGTFATSFNASKLSEGTYFYTLKTENGTATNRMVVKR